MVQCSACSNCHNDLRVKDEKITFHLFPGQPNPKDQERREKWIKFVRRDNWKPSTGYMPSRLCSEHFNLDDFEKCDGKWILKNTAVPSIFTAFQEGSKKMVQMNLEKKSPTVRGLKLFERNDAPLAKLYTELVPVTPENKPTDAYNWPSKISETPEKASYEACDDLESSDLRGQRIVESFGDKNCQIKHFFDKEATFDAFDKVITNCNFYLQLAAKNLSKSLNRPNHQEILWLAIIIKNWSDIEMPETATSNWMQITFPVWDAIMKHNCNLCIYQEYYLTDFGDIVPQHRFKKLLQETLQKMNLNISSKYKAANLIITKALTIL